MVSLSPLACVRTCGGACPFAFLFDTYLQRISHMMRTLEVVGSEQQAATGGGKAPLAGESTRLKLQTPLFVADALIQAAQEQLDLEHAACKQEVRRFWLISCILRSDM